MDNKVILLLCLIQLLASAQQTVFLECNKNDLNYIALDIGNQNYQKQYGFYVLFGASNSSMIISTICPDSKCSNTDKFSCQESAGCQQTFKKSTIQLIGGDSVIQLDAQIVSVPISWSNANKEASQISDLKLDLVVDSNYAQPYPYYNAFSLGFEKGETNLLNQIESSQIYFTLIDCQKSYQTNIQSQISFGEYNHTIVQNETDYSEFKLDKHGLDYGFDCRIVIYDQNQIVTALLDTNHPFIDLPSVVFQSVLSHLQQSFETSVDNDLIRIKCSENCNIDHLYILSLAYQESKPIIIEHSNLITKFNDTLSIINFRNSTSNTITFGKPFFYSNVVGFQENNMKVYKRVQSIEITSFSTLKSYSLIITLILVVLS